MTNQPIKAARLRVGTTEDGKAIGIIAADAKGSETAVVFDASKAEGLLVDILLALYRLAGGSPVEGKTAGKTLEYVPANQFVVSVGDTEGVLSVVVGRARLNFRSPSTASLRSFGRSAIEAADVLEHGAPKRPTY